MTKDGDAGPIRGAQSFKPLIPVGSYVLAQKPHSKGEMAGQNALRVEQVLEVVIHIYVYFQMASSVPHASIDQS